MLYNISNVPKRVTIALCGLNLVVAIYLTSIVFRPLYSGVGNDKGLPAIPSHPSFFPVCCHNVAVGKMAHVSREFCIDHARRLAVSTHFKPFLP